MTEKMIARLADLRARQHAGEHMRCPRCGQDTMKPDLKTNALSRHVEDVYICDSCGTASGICSAVSVCVTVSVCAQPHSKRIHIQHIARMYFMQKPPLSTG